MIQARFNDGFTVEDFKKVHEIKAKMWLDNESRIYLRPSTLYRPSKFAGYLQEYSFNQNDEKNKSRGARKGGPGRWIVPPTRA